MPKLPKLPVDNTMPPVWLNWFNAVYNASLQNPNIFNVLSYGAKGDGTTDDSRGFQSAINAATIAGNGIVYAPDTNNGYAFGSAVKLPSNVLLLGDNKKGLELSRIKPTPGYTGNLVESIGWSATAANATKIQNSGIVGFFFDGSSTTLTAVDTYCQECVFLDNTFKNMYTYGMRIAGKSSATNDLGLNNNIHHNYFSKVGSTKFWDAIFEDYYTADNKYTNNYIEGCQNASIETRGANSLITENHLFDTKHHILSLDSVEKQITDNYLEFCTHSSIRVENGSSSEQQLFMIAANNLFRNINTSNAAHGVIELNGNYCNYALIQGNALRRDSGTSYNTDYFVWKSAGFTQVVLDSTNFIYVPACINTALIN